MSAETPRPWKADISPATDYGPAYVRAIVGLDGGTIRVSGFALSSGDEPEANAELIVRAVNSLEATERLAEELEKALKKATGKLERTLVLLGYDSEFVARDVEEFRTALASIAEWRKQNG